MLVAESVAERVLEAMDEPFELNGTQFYATGSLGISLFPQDATDAHSLLRNADQAMYQSKKNEPGRYTMFSAGGEDAMKRLSLTTRLREAVQMEHWVLHWQPVVNLQDGSVESVEALIRWQDPNGGIVPPGEFIPLAEELGLIEAIGDWVIGELARQQNEWKEQGLDIKVGFNLSPRQLWSAHLAEKVLGKLAGAGVDPHRIVVEITESTAMADPDRTQKILQELHAWGLTIALDDFGTGYSSLARLKHLPVDILKIDRSFIRDVDDDPSLASMVRGDDPARRGARHDAARRGHRDGRGVRVPPGERLSAGAGVPLRPPDARRGDPRARYPRGRPAPRPHHPVVRPRPPYPGASCGSLASPSPILLAVPALVTAGPGAAQPAAEVRDIGPSIGLRQHESSYAIAVARRRTTTGGRTS